MSDSVGQSWAKATGDSTGEFLRPGFLIPINRQWAYCKRCLGWTRTASQYSICFSVKGVHLRGIIPRRGSPIDIFVHLMKWRGWRPFFVRHIFEYYFEPLKKFHDSKWKSKFPILMQMFGLGWTIPISGGYRSLLWQRFELSRTSFKIKANKYYLRIGE